jgi:prepilin-type N-terminal cleavage/methylation domain-containing protein
MGLSERQMRAPRGFTLLEMMTVLVVSLLMMIMIVPIFNVSTHTVRLVERKLAVYEAARGLLDELEDNIRRSATNERGEMFALKSMQFTDTDTFTPNNPDPSAKFAASSIRSADRLQFLFMRQGIGNGWRDYATISSKVISPPFAGSRNFALSYDQWMGDLYEGCVASNLHDCFDNNYVRKDLLADVSKLECAILISSRISRGNYDDEWPDYFAVGNEIGTPNYMNPASGWGTTTIPGLRMMDFEVAYWDEGAKRYKRAPLDTAIYFAPLPRALRITMTVCDGDKRTSATLARIINLPTGVADCDDVVDTRDDVYFEADPSDPLHPKTTEFFRTKNLNTLDTNLYK